MQNQSKNTQTITTQPRDKTRMRKRRSRRFNNVQSQVLKLF